MSKATNPRDEFRDRLRSYGIRNTEITSDNENKLYVYPKEGGYGIPNDCYDGLDVRLVESSGMESIDEGHPLYRSYAHHVLIFIATNAE